MENNNKNDRENSVGYTLGTIVGAVFVTCAAVAVIAATIKFLMLLF